MTPYLKEKSNRKIKNVKRAAYLKYLFICEDLKISEVARELNITRQSLHRFINGSMKSARIEDWFRDFLAKAKNIQIFDDEVLQDLGVKYERN